jgi:hypothetical protein
VPRTDPNYFIHKPELITINATFADDPYTVSVIKPYLDGAYASFSVSGFTAMNPVAKLTVDLEMRRSVMSSGQAAWTYASACGAQRTVLGWCMRTSATDR